MTKIRIGDIVELSKQYTSIKKRARGIVMEITSAKDGQKMYHIIVPSKFVMHNSARMDVYAYKPELKKIF